MKQQIVSVCLNGKITENILRQNKRFVFDGMMGYHSLT